MGKLDKAEEYFKKYLKAQENYDPSKETVNLILLYVRARHIAYYGLGLIAQFRKDHKKAEDYYLKALQEQEPYLDIYSRLSRIYLDREDFPKAGEFADKELAINPDFDLALLYKALCCDWRGDEEQAEIYLSKALEVTKGNAEVFERAGCFWANRQKYERAIAAFERLRAARPGYIYATKLLARVFYDMGDFEKSRVYYEAYAASNSGDVEAINDLGNCHFKLGDYEEAERVYSGALDIDDCLPATYRNAGLAKWRLGKMGEALVWLEKYIKAAPEDIEIELAIAGIYGQVGQFGEAIAHYENFLKKNPSNVEGLFGISECYFSLGYKDSAVIGYQQVLKLDPAHEASRARLEEITAQPSLV